MIEIGSWIRKNLEIYPRSKSGNFDCGTCEIIWLEPNKKIQFIKLFQIFRVSNFPFELPETIEVLRGVLKVDNYK